MTEFSMLEDVGSIAADLSNAQQIGLDTEFMREKTFFAELCLVQVSTSAGIYCVDPLAASDMQDFWADIMQVPWVVHSARQDIEVISQTAGQMPATLLDTQVAAALLGYAPQMGYAALVNELFNVEIAKSHTRADWSRRPLSPAALQYAAEDVEYLLPAWEKLSERLDKLGRLQWALEDSAALLDPALYDIDPQSAIKRLKGARNLRGRRRSAAARLAAWRENEALRANRPRQWIVRDAALLEIAATLPTSVRQLEQVDGLAAGLIRRSGKRLIDVVAESANDKHNHQRPRSPNEGQKALLKKMQARVADYAEGLGVSAEIIAPKKELSAIIIDGQTESRLFSGWRRESIGEELFDLL